MFLLTDARDAVANRVVAPNQLYGSYGARFLDWVDDVCDGTLLFAL